MGLAQGLRTLSSSAEILPGGQQSWGLKLLLSK